MSFCDFCNCEQCRNGGMFSSTLPLHHAQCNDDRWICEVCYLYDVCTSGPNRSKHGPCETKDGELDIECQHRPKLVSKWIPFKR